ncbi:importin N-terminal domain-containing protein, partial [Haematococcus lacustris]
MIGAEGEASKREEYLARLMAPPNATWQTILASAQGNPDVLKAPEATRSIQNVLQTNVSVCSSLGQPYAQQFNVIFADMLQ